MARGRPKKEVKAANGLPHPEVLKTLASQVSAAQADAREAAGEVGAFMKNGESAHGIDRKAFKLAVQLTKMDGSKLNQFLKHLDHYRTVFELDKLAGQDMFDRDATANGNQPDNEPVPATDEQEEDPRSPDLKRHDAEIEAEQAAKADPVAAVVADNVTKLRRGIKAKPAPEGEATGTYLRH